MVSRTGAGRRLLYFNGSVAWTKAKLKNSDAIHNAPELSAYGAIILRYPEGLITQLQVTYSALGR